MIVLGIDPGFANVGFVVVNTDTRDVLTASVIETKATPKKFRLYASDDNTQRAQFIAQRLIYVVQAYRCSQICAEAQSWPRNASVSAKIGMCWGVIASLGLAVRQVTPQDLKIKAAGNRSASKFDVQKSLCAQYPTLQNLLQTIKPSLQEHAVDALGSIHAVFSEPV